MPEAASSARPAPWVAERHRPGCIGPERPEPLKPNFRAKPPTGRQIGAMKPFTGNPITDRRERRRVRGPGTEGPPRPECSNILVVDDSSTTRSIIRRLLAPADVTITEAEDGLSALATAAAHRFDLIITDIDMPRMNGFELCRRLKENPDTRHAPVIILSANNAEGTVNEGFQAGAAAFIGKGDIRGELPPTVSRILEKYRFQQERLILVVDDSPMIRRLVGNGLQEAGYQVLTADNGRTALELLRTARPDLILSDIDMPEMDGFEFCERVGGDKRLMGVPFVVMSANGDRANMQRMLHRGAEAYLVKPFNMDQLVILVDKLISDQYLMLLKEKERLDGEREMIIASIASLVQALEARDPYTRGHSEGVARILAGMADAAGFSAADAEAVVMGGKLHDIGKIGIRDAVLLKEGKLDAREYALIQDHPRIGADILSSIPSLSPIVSMVLAHHERFDGKGYPHGIGGEEIPLWARMTAVADTFDALTTLRPYRPPTSFERAAEIIRQARGTQLCPESVDLFFHWFNTRWSP